MYLSAYLLLSVSVCVSMHTCIYTCVCVCVTQRDENEVQSAVVKASGSNTLSKQIVSLSLSSDDVHTEQRILKMLLKCENGICLRERFQVSDLTLTHLEQKKNG